MARKFGHEPVSRTPNNVLFSTSRSPTQQQRKNKIYAPQFLDLAESDNEGELNDLQELNDTELATTSALVHGIFADIFTSDAANDSSKGEEEDFTCTMNQAGDTDVDSGSDSLGDDPPSLTYRQPPLPSFQNPTSTRPNQPAVSSAALRININTTDINQPDPQQYADDIWQFYECQGKKIFCKLCRYNFFLKC